MTRHEAGLQLKFIDPNDQATIESAHALIEKRAKEGHVLPRSLEDVRGIAARCAAAYLNASGEVVAFGGVTREYHQNDDLTQPVVAAEYGAMVTASGYEGNGFSSDVTQEVAARYLDDTDKQQNRAEEFILFAMAHKGGPGRRVFDKLHLHELSEAESENKLPDAAFDDGKEYYNFDLNTLRRERPN